jgi:hypothetical protein
MPTLTEDDARALLATVDEAPAPPADTAPPSSGPTKSKRPTTRAGRAARAAAAAKADATPKATGGRPSTVALSVQAVHEMAGGVALPLMGRPATGQLLASSGKQAGQVWAKLAKRYPAIEKVFAATGDGALLLELLMVYAPIIMMAVNEKPGQAGPGLDLGALLGMAGGAPPG